MSSPRCSPKNSSGRKRPSKLQQEFLRALCKALEKNAPKIQPELKLLAYKPGKGKKWRWLVQGLDLDKLLQPKRRRRGTR